MDEYKGLIEIVTGVFSVVGSIWAACTLVISHWAKKSEHIKKLEGSILNSEIESVKKDLDKHQKMLQVASVELKQSREELIKIQGRLETAGVKLESTNEKLSIFHEDTKDRIERIEKTFDHGELVSVGGGSVMIRAKTKKG